MLEGQELNIAFMIIILNITFSSMFITMLSSKRRLTALRGGLLGLFVSLLVYSLSYFILLVTVNFTVAKPAYWISLFSFPFMVSLLISIAIFEIFEEDSKKAKLGLIPILLAFIFGIISISLASDNDISFTDNHTIISPNSLIDWVNVYTSVLGTISLIIFYALWINAKGAKRVQNKWLFFGVFICSLLEVITHLVLDQSNYGLRLISSFSGITVMSGVFVFVNVTYQSFDINKIRDTTFNNSNIVPIFYYDEESEFIYSNIGLKNLLNSWPGAPLLMSDFIEALLSEFPDKEFPKKPAKVSLKITPHYPSSPKRIQATFAPLPNIKENACLIVDLSTEDEKWEKHKETINSLTHDVRNPISIISGALEILDDDTDQATAASLLGMIRAANEQVNTLMNEFFILEDQEETSFTPELFCPVEEAIRISQTFVPIFNCKKQQFTVNLTTSSNEKKIFTSKIDFYRIITNLLSNAHYHAGSQTKIEISCFTEDRTITLQVKDWGKGIAPEKIDTLFSRKTISYKDCIAEDDRLGIGLYSVYLLIKRNNGNIMYEENEEGGSCFKVSFPALN